MRRYKDVVPAILLLSALLMVMVGVSLVRLGVVTVEVRINRDRRAAVAEPSEPRLAQSPSPAADAPRGALPVAEVAPAPPLSLAGPAPVMETTTTDVVSAPTPGLSEVQTPVPGSAPAPPPDPDSAVQAPPATRPVKPLSPRQSRALAVAAAKSAAKSARLVDCAPVTSGALAPGTLDSPALADIAGSAGLADRELYFKRKGKTAVRPCPPAALTASTAR